jgi:hypothetical protein
VPNGSALSGWREHKNEKPKAQHDHAIALYYARLRHRCWLLLLFKKSKNKKKTLMPQLSRRPHRSRKTFGKS